jgi:hypothetical protein
LKIVSFLSSSLNTGTSGKRDLIGPGTNSTTRKDINVFFPVIICHVSFLGMELSRKLKRALVAKHKWIHNGLFIPEAMLITTHDFIGSFGKVCPVKLRMPVAFIFGYVHRD